MICCPPLIYLMYFEDSAQIPKACPKKFFHTPASRNFGSVTSRFRHIHINWTGLKDEKSACSAISI